MDCSTIFPTFKLNPLTNAYKSMARSYLTVETCFVGGENGVDEVKPNLYYFRQVSFVYIGVADGFGPLPYPQTVCQLINDLFELGVLLKLFVLLAVIHWPRP